MKVADLQAMLDKHLQDKNYQHKGKSWAEIDILALASFSRLSNDPRVKILKVCKKYGIDSAMAMRVRFMAQTNLFFLCKFLGYDAVSDSEYVWTDGTVHNTHEEIANDFFVRKTPTVKTFEAFATAYIDKKERLLLVPRGGFKSTMDMTDCIQYICCWPEVTIMILTGVLGLAEDRSEEHTSELQ